MSSSPKISVLMPVYNAERFLAPAIESILAQEFKDFEFICVNDGSVDQSLSILEAYAARDGRIRVANRLHSGLVSCLNYGIGICRAPIIARMDADDVSLPSRLRLQYEHMAQKPHLWVLGTSRIMIGEYGTQIHRPSIVHGESHVARALARTCVICHPSVIMRREPVVNIGGYRCAYQYAEDYDLWLRIIEHAQIDNLPVPGIMYRVHNQSISEKTKIGQRVSAALAQATHALRVSGARDPTDFLQVPPDLWTDPILDDLIPEYANFFRAVHVLFRADASDNEKRCALRNVRMKTMAVKKQNEKLWQDALLYAGHNHSRVDGFKFTTFAEAAFLHPARFFRSVVALRRTPT